MAEEYEMEPLNQASSQTIQETSLNNTPVASKQFFVLAKENKWNQAIRSIQRSCIDFVQLMNEIDLETGQNILHLASQSEIHKDAVMYAEHILNTSRIEDKHDLIQLINHLDKKEQTPLHIAIKSRNKDLVELLLRRGANTILPMPFAPTEKTISVLYKTFPEIMLKLFDENLDIVLDKDQSYKEEMDYVQCNFTPIIALQPTKPNFFEKYTTNNLAVILPQPRKTKSKILLHPLVQLFLHFKHEEYKVWIWFSVFIHILWNLSSCIFMFHNAHIPVQSNFTMTTNITMCEMKDDCTRIHFDSCYFVAMYVMWPILTFKECVELFMCPDRSFYQSQAENIGQWGIIFIDLIVFLSAIFTHEIELPDNVVLVVIKLQPLLAIAFLIGIPLSILLIQLQISKFRCAGIYIEMFIQCLINIGKLILIFSPLLVSFMAFFHGLLPKDSKFSATYVYGVNKLLVMMIGDFDYEKMFEATYGAPFVLAQIIFFFFVISVSILLQNLLVGLTVSDVQKLRERASEKYLEKLLENIYLHEGFWIWSQNRLRRQNNSMPNNSEQIRVNNLPSDLRKALAEWQETQKTRNKICKSCGSSDIMDAIKVDFKTN